MDDYAGHSNLLNIFQKIQARVPKAELWFTSDGPERVRLEDKKKNLGLNNVKFFEQYWETKLDPNPGLTVVEIMESIYEKKIQGLYIMGENPAMSDPNANHAREALSKEILHIGYCESYDDYKDWLWKSDILPVTSIQDFFGVSIMEAVYSNTYPILPERLSYTELFNIKANPEIFYKNDSELYNKLKFAIENHSNLPSYSSIAEKFDWFYMASEYDNLFEKFWKCNSSNLLLSLLMGKRWTRFYTFVDLICLI